jgi:hypothetical protein
MATVVICMHVAGAAARASPLKSPSSHSAPLTGALHVQSSAAQSSLVRIMPGTRGYWRLRWRALLQRCSML